MSLPSSNPQPDHPAAREYNRMKRRLELADLVLGLGFVMTLLATGWNRGLRDLAVRAGGEHYALQLFFYVVFLSVISKILSGGLDFYAFLLERRYDLSQEKPGAWLKDEIKSWLLGLLICSVLAEFVYLLMRASPEYWWLAAWFVFSLLMIFFMQIAPVAIFPLFYKFVPLRNEELTSRLVRMGERAGTRIRGVYEWKLSEKSRKANAAIAGLGRTRRIILADTLLRNYTEDEIETVMAHELGHHVHGHLFKSILIEAAITLLGFWSANWVLQYAKIHEHAFLQLDSITDFANLPLVVLTFSALSMLLLPALNAYSRFNERQADLYCWKAVSTVAPFVSAMEKLNAQNLGEQAPSRLVEILFHSHPPISKRIAAAHSWARRNLPSLSV